MVFSVGLIGLCAFGTPKSSKINNCHISLSDSMILEYTSFFTFPLSP